MDKKHDDSTQTEQPYNAPAIENRELLTAMMQIQVSPQTCAFC